MSKPIGVGDIVQIIKHPCCGKNIGKTFVVERLLEATSSTCPCGVTHPERFHAVFVPPLIDYWCFPVAWLRRIDPLSEPESTHTSEPERIEHE